MFLEHLERNQIVIVAVAVLVAMLGTVPRSSAQTYTVLHSFTDGADGSRPTAGVTLQGTSNLFGGAGRVALYRARQMGTGWTLTPIFDFNDTDGLYPSGRVTFGPGGALYGAASSGGLPECTDGGGCGVIFSMRPPSSFCRSVSCPWTETILYQFDPQHRADGFGPGGGLVFDAAGNMYGAAGLGGLFGGGTVFELSPSQGGWSETILHHFGQQQSDGMVPLGHLIIDAAGSLIIGTTQEGGTNGGCFDGGCGVVYELTRTGSGWTETILHTFSRATDGGTPGGGLISDAAGNLFGTTQEGGPNNGGTVYELTPSNGGYTFQVVYALTGITGTIGATGLLAIDSTGNLYGVAGPGAFSHGMVFKLTPGSGSWTLADLHDFDGTNGGVPLDGPTLDSSGNLYGTTFYGGTGSCSGGCGVLWQLTP
jgi:uncharacterized repeat protein (TIGR03803 family)